MRIHVLSLCLVLLLVACGKEPISNDKQLHVILRGTSAQLDPPQVLDRYGASLIRNIFQGLYRYQYLSRPYRLTPDLAAALPQISPDGLVYTIRLRTDAVFRGLSEGPRPVTADDVIYSLLRHFDSSVQSRWRWLFRDLVVGADAWSEQADYDQPPAGLVALDDHTVQIRLTRVAASFVHTLATPGASIVPREAVEAQGREFGIAPVGSGPYRLSRFDTFNALLTLNQSELRLDLADEGANQPQLIVPPQEIRVSFVVDPGPAWLAFLDGADVLRMGGSTIDQVVDLQRGIIPKAEYTDLLDLVSHPEFGFVRLDFNLGGPLGRMPGRSTEDLHALRCALVKAFDWEQRNKLFYQGLATIHPGVIPPGLVEHDPHLERSSVTLDIDGAKRLLADHNWTADSLPPIKYGFQAGVQTRQGFEDFRSMMQAIGYPGDKILASTYANWGDISKAAKEGEFDIYIAGWTLDYPDVENVLQLYYGPNRSPGSNFSRYANPDYDRAYEQLTTMLPGPQRSQLAQTMNRMLIDDCVMIGSVNRRVIYAVRKGVDVQPDQNLLQGTWQRFARKEGTQNSS